MLDPEVFTRPSNRMKDNRLIIIRFDDTNPEAEEEIYFLAIDDIVRWLGRTF